MAMLVAAGFLDNLVLEADGRRILVKGRTTKEMVLAEETENTEVYRERLRTTVVALGPGRWGDHRHRRLALRNDNYPDGCNASRITKAPPVSPTGGASLFSEPRQHSRQGDYP